MIKLNPGFVYAYFNRANLRCAQRDFRAAIVDYNEAIGGTLNLPRLTTTGVSPSVAR